MHAICPVALRVAFGKNAQPASQGIGTVITVETVPPVVAQLPLRVNVVFGSDHVADEIDGACALPKVIALAALAGGESD
jgi:hypothetical protein